MESVEESITILSRVSSESILIILFLFFCIEWLLFHDIVIKYFELKVYNVSSSQLQFLLPNFQREGFDYEFVPPLDPKYECAICLLGLRSPIQTTCGHRFCKDCIFNCMRYYELRFFFFMWYNVKIAEK